MRLMQVLISVDQTLNAFCGGWADETLSARAYRCSNKPHWKKAKTIIDKIFFWQDNHCLNAYLVETNRQQLPPEYRSKP